MDGVEVSVPALFAAVAMGSRKGRPTEVLLHYSKSYDGIRKSMGYEVGAPPAAASRPNDAEVRHSFQIFVKERRVNKDKLLREYGYPTTMDRAWKEREMRRTHAKVRGALVRQTNEAPKVGPSAHRSA